MIKIFYNGYMVRNMNNHLLYFGEKRPPEFVKEYFYLDDDDLETLNVFGKVKLRYVIGKFNPYEECVIDGECVADDEIQYSGIFTDRRGEETPFVISISEEQMMTKKSIIYEQDNDNILKLIFDDDTQQTNPEPPINPVENNTSAVQHYVEPKEEISLLNAPATKDNWFEAINEVVNKFHAESGAKPTAAKVWGLLCENPPHGYAITVDKDGSLTMPSYKKLSNNAFTQRMKRYGLS